MPIYKKMFNENYFSCIDTENKAYWLGFLYADGCVFRCTETSSINGKVIRTSKTDKLTLSSIDIEHLEKLKNCMEANNSILLKARKGREADYGYIVFNSVKLCDDLESVGCTQRKSLTLEFPSTNILPVDLQRHFIRGYFDGDGCISVRYSNNDRNIAYPRLTFLGTCNFLVVIRKILDVNYTIANVSKIWSMEIGSAKNFRRVVKYLYDDSLMYLNRKKVMAYSYL